MKVVFAALIGLLLNVSVARAELEPITSEAEFVERVAERELRIFGIRVSVLRDGKIAGKAYGRSVTGQWTWKNGYFCRDLYWGQRDLGPNCQEVRIHGDTVRFTSDKGTGRYADLKMR